MRHHDILVKATFPSVWQAIQATEQNHYIYGMTLCLGVAKMSNGGVVLGLFTNFDAIFKGLSKLILSCPASDIVGGADTAGVMDEFRSDGFMGLMEQGDVIIRKGATKWWML